MKHEINTENTGYGWAATFEGYDGADDATGKYSLIGHGPTECDAMLDLITRGDDLEAK